jgi:glycosyltransferase involved in cell wall biosynthesis
VSKGFEVGSGMRNLLGPKTFSYIEFGHTGHRSIWVRSVVNAFLKSENNGKLRVWVPKEFCVVNKEWCEPFLHPNPDGVEFVFFEDRLMESYTNGEIKSFDVVMHCLQTDNPDVCFVANNLDSLVSRLAFLAPGRVQTKIVGVMDQPHLHYAGLDSESTRTWLEGRRRFRAFFANLLLCHRGFIGEILMLDPTAPEYYRSHLFSRKFRFLPEYIDSTEPESDPRKVLGLPREKQILLFIGPSDKRKGIQELLPAFEEDIAEDANFREHVALVLAGTVLPESKELVYGSVSRFQRLYPGNTIVLHDRILSDQEFVDFIHASDVVCIPYVDFVGTSGILIQAAAAGRPVLASDFGLVGEMVRKFHLGVACNTLDQKELQRAIRQSLAVASAMTQAHRQALRQFAVQHCVPLERFGEEVVESLMRVAHQR